eukprot:scaffold1395_cov244-Pinguiococcus_pyrenoidosus.AAC.6
MGKAEAPPGNTTAETGTPLPTRLRSTCRWRGRGGVLLAFRLDESVAKHRLQTSLTPCQMDSKAALSSCDLESRSHPRPGQTDFAARLQRRLQILRGASAMMPYHVSSCSFRIFDGNLGAGSRRSASKDSLSVSFAST